MPLRTAALPLPAASLPAERQGAVHAAEPAAGARRIRLRVCFPHALDGLAGHAPCRACDIGIQAAGAAHHA